MLLPALGKAKVKATTAACLGNEKQLGTTWYMYADENSDKMVNLGTYTPGGTLSPVNTPWRTDMHNNELIPNGARTTQARRSTFSGGL